MATATQARCGLCTHQVRPWSEGEHLPDTQLTDPKENHSQQSTGRAWLPATECPLKQARPVRLHLGGSCTASGPSRRPALRLCHRLDPTGCSQGGHELLAFTALCPEVLAPNRRALPCPWIYQGLGTLGSELLPREPPSGLGTWLLPASRFFLMLGQGSPLGSELGLQPGSLHLSPGKCAHAQACLHLDEDPPG